MNRLVLDTVSSEISCTMLRLLAKQKNVMAIHVSALSYGHVLSSGHMSEGGAQRLAVLE